MGPQADSWEKEEAKATARWVAPPGAAPLAGEAAVVTLEEAARVEAVKAAVVAVVAATVVAAMTAVAWTVG